MTKEQFFIQRKEGSYIDSRDGLGPQRVSPPRFAPKSTGANAIKQYANREGLMGWIDILRDYFTEPDRYQARVDRSLRRAVRDGNHQATEALLQPQGARLDALSEKGTALHEAVVGRNRGIVSLLLRQGADPNLVEPGTGKSALHLAAEQCNSGGTGVFAELHRDPRTFDMRDANRQLAYDKARTLIQGMSKCTERDRARADKLMQRFATLAMPTAIAEGNHVLVRELLGAGADVDRIFPGTEKTVLAYVIEERKCGQCHAVFEEFRKAGRFTSNATVALLSAIKSNDSRLVRELLHAGADVLHIIPDTQTTVLDTVASCQCTPEVFDQFWQARILHLHATVALPTAAKAGNVRLVKDLLEANADVLHIFPGAQKTVLAYVIEDGQCTRAVREEFARHANLTLPRAIEAGNLPLVTALLDAGADVNRIIPGTGRTVLDIVASSECSSDVFVHFQDAGIFNRYANLALPAAIKNHNFLLVKQMLDAGADIFDRFPGTEDTVLAYVIKDRERNQAVREEFARYAIRNLPDVIDAGRPDVAEALLGAIRASQDAFRLLQDANLLTPDGQGGYQVRTHPKQVRFASREDASHSGASSNRLSWISRNTSRWT